jgi:transposase InsO family protein
VLRLMREANLLAPTRCSHAHRPKAYDGTITTDRPDLVWGTDATSVLTGAGQATVLIAVDHCTKECIGIHAAFVGRPSIAVVTYVRLMDLKHRHGWGYERLGQRVADSFQLRRLSRI